jgi:N-ethylmaleimide reductase
MESIKNSSKNILKPFKLGPYTLRNRIAMSALTRCRADPKTSIPNDLHVKYYSERAEGAGFILTECTAISQRGNAFQGACGIWSKEQIEGWKRVTNEVHKVDRRIYLQIWHGGRAGDPKHLGGSPYAPSALPIRNYNKATKLFESLHLPEELSEEGILEVLGQFKTGAKNAYEAGFDGLELHGANGYLIDSFLRDATNRRTDKWGGSVENRCRFPLMVIDALAEVFGPDRVGTKLSPVGRFQDMFDSDPLNNYIYLLKELDKRKISFVEIVRAPEFVPIVHQYGMEGEEQIPDVYTAFRPFFKGTLIGNNNFSFEEADKFINEGHIDMVTFGKLFLSNPDLVERFRNGWSFNPIRPKLFYASGAAGYTDYPKYSQPTPKF